MGRALTQQLTDTNKKIFGIFDDDMKNVHGRSVAQTRSDTKLAHGASPRPTRFISQLVSGSYRDLTVNNTSTLPQYVNAFNCKVDAVLVHGSLTVCIRPQFSPCLLRVPRVSCPCLNQRSSPVRSGAVVHGCGHHTHHKLHNVQNQHTGIGGSLSYRRAFSSPC